MKATVTEVRLGELARQRRDGIELDAGLVAKLEAFATRAGRTGN